MPHKLHLTFTSVKKAGKSKVRELADLYLLRTAASFLDGWLLVL